MPLQIVLGILVIANSLSLILIKIATKKFPEKKSGGLFWQFTSCSIVATLYFLFSGDQYLTPAIFLVALIGFINSFGNYFQWKAFEAKLSQAVLFMPLADVTAIALAVSFLNEGALWTPKTAIGIILCFFAMWLFLLSASKEKTAENTNSKTWLLFIIPSVLIFGFSGFMLKVFSLEIPRETFFMGWYIGAFVGTLPLVIIEKAHPFTQTKKNIFICFITGITIATTLLLLYWTYQLGWSISLTNPLRGIGILIIPSIIGLFLFKERKSFTKTEWIGFVLGALGATTLI